MRRDNLIYALNVSAVERRVDALAARPRHASGYRVADERQACVEINQ